MPSSPIATQTTTHSDTANNTSKTASVKIRILPAIAMFTVGFAVMATSIHMCIQHPLRLYAEIRSEKLAVMQSWVGHATTAAFGSSHVDTGFDPRSFDEAMRGTQEQTVGLNLGISGGSQTEQIAVAKAFLASLPPFQNQDNARFVLLEITAGVNFTNGFLFHPRTINIYDLSAVRTSMDFSDRRLGWRHALGRSGFAFVASALHYTNVGMLSSAIFQPALKQSLLIQQTAGGRRGLTVLDPLPSTSSESVSIQQLVNAKHAPQMQQPPLVKGYTTVLDELAPFARQKHVQLIYFVVPRLDNLVVYPQYPETVPGPDGLVPILNVASPILHPELYRAENWRDPAHLNEAGAALFSRLLAQELEKRMSAAGDDHVIR